MAELRNVVRRSPLSQFETGRPEAGHGFRMLADMANTAYEALLPAAIQEQEEAGRKQAVAYAKSQVANMPPPPQAARSVGRDISYAPTAVNAAIISAAEKHGVPVHEMMMMAELESAFDPAAQNPNSSAGGLFQFIDSTAAQYGLEDRNDPNQSADAAARLRNDNVAVLRSALGREPTAGEVYLAHQQGAGGASALLSASPMALASGVVGEDAVRLNGGDPATMTASQFAALWVDKANAAAQKYMGSGPEVEASDDIKGEDFQHPEPVTITGTDGMPDMRTYSPVSGPILQAHNAAGNLAYLSEVLVKSEADLMGLSEVHALNPESFRTASEEYIRGIVDNAPPELRDELSTQVSQQVQSRYLGMWDDKHADTRRRANNSSAALIERYSAQYSKALSNGDDRAAERFLAQLNSALVARESMPGASWTPAQSDKTILDARRAADKEITRRQKDAREAVEDSLKLIIKSAKVDRSAENEAVLNDPATFEMFPELATEAAAMVHVRDSMPGFRALSAGEQEQVLEELRAQPVQQDWQLDVQKAFEKTYAQARKDVADDPIAFREEHSQDAVPALPDAKTMLSNPTALATALARRATYARELVAGGYAPSLRFLTNDERDSIKSMLDESGNPVVRASVAEAFINGLAGDAPRMLQELGADGVLVSATALRTVGGDSSVVTDALRGQQMLAEKLVAPPPIALRRDAMTGDNDVAFPVSPSLRGQMLDLAASIYAEGASGIDPQSGEAEDLYSESLQRAAGQTKFDGITRGGVQDVHGTPTLLMPGISASDVERGFREALGATTTRVNRRGDPIGTDREPDLSRFQGRQPMWNGKPLTESMMRNGSVSIQPLVIEGNMVAGKYQMMVNGETYVKNPDGTVFFFDITDLVYGAQ